MLSITSLKYIFWIYCDNFLNFSKLNKENDKALPSMTLKDLKKEREMKNEKTKPKGDLAQSSSRENSRRRYSRSRSKSRSRERSSSYYRSRDHTDIYRWSRSRSRERSGRSARKRSHSPDDGDDRYTKQSNIKEKIAQIPEYSVREELRKRRELMELKELIAHQKAMVSMEQSVKQIEPDIEVDIERGITTFDYQHVHRESMWMPDLKPTKSILKKQSELPDPQSQVSTCKETASFVKGESLNMQMGYRQRISAFDLNEPAYSKFESDSKKSLTTEGSEKIRLPEFKDSELVRKKKRLEELSESIGRKIAIIAMEQKPKSILKKRSELLSSQSETTSVDYCGQASQDDFVFTKLPSQSTAGALFDRSSNRQSVHSDTLGLFNRLLKESSATLHVTEPSHFNKPVVPQLVTQASNLWSLHDPKPSSMSKGCNSQDDQHWGSSRQTNEHPHSSNPSASQAALLDQKRTLTTQMERFLGALNKADSCIVNSLFHEARNDQALMSTQKHSQPQLDMNIPFMDELYDPFKEDEDNGHHPFIGRSVGKHSVREQTKSPVKTESHFYDPNKDDLLSNERAVQDGSRFSWLVGIKDLEPNKDTFRDEHKVEDDVLTNLKRIIMNFKSTKDTQESSSSSTTVSQFSYQPASTYVVSTAQPGSSQYAQISTSPALSTSQYSYHSNEQKFRGSTCPLDSSQNTNLQLSAYPYGTVPLPPNLGYASGQQVMAPHMMSSYSSYTTPMGNPYSACPPLTMPIPYGFPPISNPLLLSSMNSSYTTLHAGQNITDKKTQPVRSLKTIESKETVVTTVDVKGEPKGIPKNKVNNRPAKSLQKIAGIKLVSTTIKDDIMAKQKNERTRLRRIQRKRARRRLNYMKQAF
ncbi:uncharacterized protein LOC127660521 [Xyrauchen texanus]|uniref:uncharacterized protein LOC127660521 n=1 Tax=Xyrauchen texanus TaxID=154827 RepID=UPI0022426131|nr:uncharacterized protein LOC127660521 [Xyrauchen texanus]